MADDTKLDAAFESQTMALKPDFKEITPDSIAALLKDHYGDGSQIELTDVQGGSEMSGMSSGIVIFDAKIGGEAAEFVLRYAPLNNPGRIFAEYNIEGQYHLHGVLNEAGLPVPRSVCCDAAGEILPLPGFIMNRVEGRAPDNPAYTSGIFAEATPEQRDSYRDDTLKALDQLHNLDWQKLGLERFCSLADEGKTLIERHLNWFWKTAQWSGLDPQSLSRIERLKQWLIANDPNYHRDDMTMTHGDSNLANYMFNDGKLVAMLDWEIAAIAQPALDVLGQCDFIDYCRSISPPEVQQIIPSRESWIARYEEISGKRLRDMEYFERLRGYTGLVIMTSILRSIPKEHQETYSTVLEPLWAHADAVTT